MGVIEIESVKQFDEIVLNENKKHEKKYVFVDFWAEWCGPCKKIAPTIHQLSDVYKKNIYYISVNIDTVGELASKYNISSIPTFKTFVVGSLETEYDDIIGANKTNIEEKLKLLEDGIKLDDNF